MPGTTAGNPGPVPWIVWRDGRLVGGVGRLLTVTACAWCYEVVGGMGSLVTVIMCGGCYEVVGDSRPHTTTRYRLMRDVRWSLY